MIVEIIEVVVGIIILAVIIYLLWRTFQKSVSFYKETEKGRTLLHVTANCKVKKIVVLTKEGREVTKFVRTNISRGEDVEFVFPSTKSPQKLIVECDKGTFEYEVD